MNGWMSKVMSGVIYAVWHSVYKYVPCCTSLSTRANHTSHKKVFAPVMELRLKRFLSSPRHSIESLSIPDHACTSTLSNSLRNRIFWRCRKPPE
jgi:hypothetical protein